MKTIVTAVIAGFLGGVLGGWLTIQRLDQDIARWNDIEVRQPANFTIILQRDGTSGQCFSSTTPVGQAFRGHNIFWNIHNLGNCLAPGDQLEIRFKDESKDAPLEEPRPRHNGTIKAKVKRNAETRAYFYAVWLIRQAGGETRLEDPELDIVP